MKKTQKKVLGLLGLSAVIATTIFAAGLPGPEASATTTSVRDTLTVTVVNDEQASVELTGIKSGGIYVNAEHEIGLSYSGSEYVEVVLEYTDAKGETHSITLIEKNSPAGSVNYTTGEGRFQFNFVDGTMSYQLNDVTQTVSLPVGEFGYGDYVVRVNGKGRDGAETHDLKRFSFYPVIGDISKDDKTGEVHVDLDYDAYDGVGTGEVSSIVVTVYGPDGKPLDLPGLSPITVTPPQTRVELPFDKYKDLPEGKYTIEIAAYDKDGNLLYKAFYVYVNYTRKESKSVPVPDTGGLTQNLNISNSDFLITGIGAFVIVGILGALFIVKRSKRNSRR